MHILEKDALLVVDVQNDFCPGGALAIPQGDAVVPVINAIQFRFDYIVFSRDWHPHDHCSFSDTPEFCDMSWPPHCVEESAGAHFHGDLHVPSDALVISKGTDKNQEAYSAFAAQELASWLRNRHVKRVFVCGLATDVCVRATALDALQEGFETWLVVDASRGVAMESTEAALAEMSVAGIGMVPSRELE